MGAVETGLSWLESAPIWLIWLAVTVGLIIAHQIGYRSYRPSAESRTDEADESVSAGYVLPTAFALLSLLIAFTFSMAAERYQTRRGLVVSEANAVGTTYLRLQLLDEPARSELSRQ